MQPHIRILYYGIKESYEQINSAALLLKWIQNFHGTNFTIIHGSTKENGNCIVKSLLLISKPDSLRAEQLISKGINNWVLYRILHEKRARTVFHNCKLLTYPKLNEWAQWTSVIPDKKTASAYFYHIHPYTNIFWEAIANEDAEVPLLCIWPFPTTVLEIYESYLHDGS